MRCVLPIPDEEKGIPLTVTGFWHIWLSWGTARGLALFSREVGDTRGALSR